MKYAIETKNLAKSYKGMRVVDNLSIHVPEGKIYGFLGKNGAGKTTTIRMMMGLIKPDEGDIYIMGREASKERIWTSRQIGSIIETPGFYENLTAKENLDITVSLYGVPKRRIDEVLEFVELSDVGGKRARDFSLGMKQRLGIANALIHSPKILILDEPTNGLDPSGIMEMRKFLRNLSQNEGITILVSSHILSEVQQIADVVGIIDRGRLMEETDIQTLKDADQSYMLLEVDRIEQAVAALKGMKLNFEIAENGIKVFCSKSMNSQVNRSLVNKEINVYNLSSVCQTLEDRFMSITSEKSA